MLHKAIQVELMKATFNQHPFTLLKTVPLDFQQGTKINILSPTQYTNQDFIRLPSSKFSGQQPGYYLQQLYTTTYLQVNLTLLSNSITMHSTLHFVRVKLSASKYTLYSLLMLQIANSTIYTDGYLVISIATIFLIQCYLPET